MTNNEADNLRMLINLGSEERYIEGKIVPSLDVLILTDKKDEINYLTESLGKKTDSSKSLSGNYEGGRIKNIVLKEFIYEFGLGFFLKSRSELFTYKEAEVSKLGDSLIKKLCKLNLTYDSDKLNSQIDSIKKDWRLGIFRTKLTSL